MVISYCVTDLIEVGKYTANTKHSPNAVSMLAHRLRRWPNIETTLGECLVFAGISFQSLVYVRANSTVV